MPTDIKGFATRAVIFSVLTVLIFIAYMFFNQTKFIYFPDAQDFDKCPGFTESKKLHENGTRLYHTEVPSEVLIVYYHGNGGSACGRSFINDKLTSHGYATIFVEYAGYSGDNKNPSKKLILKDVENVEKYLQTLSFKKLIFMGESLGAAVSAYHQTLRQPDKMIFLSPFDKLSNVAKIHYPLLPIKTLLTEEYDVVNWIKEYRGELVIIHAEDDEIVPVRLAASLYESISTEKKEFIKLESSSHNTLFGNDRTWSEIINFIEK